MNLRTSLAIMRKDVTDAIKNQFILAFLAMPLVLALLAKLIFSGSATDAQKLKVIVYDPDHSRLVAALQAMPNIQILEVDAEERVEERVMESISANKAIGGLVIPAGFDASVAAQEQPQLTGYLNYQPLNEAQRRTFQQLLQQQVSALTPPPASIVWAEAGVLSESQNQARRFVFEDFLLVLTFTLPVVLVGVMIIPLLLVEEKEKRTLTFLLTSPASITDIVVGKALLGLVLNLAITGIVVGLNQGWKGNWVITFLALFLGALFVVPVGLLLGTLFDNAMQLNTWGNVPIMLLLLPSFFPASFIPFPALQTFLRFIPTHYLVDTLNLSLAGVASIAQVWGNLAILLGSALVGFVAVIWVLRR
jgi:ABC-2 type transport system permease protein